MKTAKKILFLILAAMLLFSIGCNRKNEKEKESDRDTDDNQSVYSGEQSEPPMFGDDVSTETESNGAKANITTYIEQDLAAIDCNFSEGLCFAKIKFEPKKVSTRSTVCFDKKGNIQFELEGGYFVECDFANGIALLQSNGLTHYICNTKGELTSCQDLGGTNVYGTQTISGSELISEMWKDGHFLVEKVTSDYSGTKHEVAIFNSKLEKTKDYSEELYTWFEKGREKYFRGFILNDNIENTIEVLDVKSGALVESTLESFYATAPINNRSDLWYSNDYKIKILGTEEVICDLKEKYPTIDYLSSFENGVASVVFETENNYYFSVLNEDFELQFDPVKCPNIGSTNQPIRDGDYFCVFRTGENTEVLVFDKNGMVSEHTFQSRGGIHFNDGIIKFTFTEFYNMQFEKLF